MREAQVLESDSDSDDSGPVYGGRSDDEGAPVMSIISCGYMCFLGDRRLAWHQKYAQCWLLWSVQPPNVCAECGRTRCSGV